MMEYNSEAGTTKHATWSGNVFVFRSSLVMKPDSYGLDKRGSIPGRQWFFSGVK